MLGWYSVVGVPPWVRWFHLQGLYADLGYKAPLMAPHIHGRRSSQAGSCSWENRNGISNLQWLAGDGRRPRSRAKQPAEMWAFNTHACEGQGSALGDRWDCQKDATRRGRGDTWRLEGSPRHLAGLLVAAPALVLGQCALGPGSTRPLEPPLPGDNDGRSRAPLPD